MKKISVTVSAKFYFYTFPILLSKKTKKFRKIHRKMSKFDLDLGDNSHESDVEENYIGVSCFLVDKNKFKTVFEEIVTISGLRRRKIS